MPTKPVSRGTFVRNFFVMLGTGLAGLGSVFVRKSPAVSVVREPRTVARRDV